jgi:hypothetical protein
MKYILQHGTHSFVKRGEDGKPVLDADNKVVRVIANPGDEVELTPDQAKSFADKFLSVEVHQAQQALTKLQADEMAALKKQNEELQAKLEAAQAAAVKAAAPAATETGVTPPPGQPSAPAKPATPPTPAK